MDKLDVLYKHRNEFIREFDSIDDGIRQFDCLVSLVEDGMSVEDMIAHGCEEKWFEGISDDSQN